MNPQQYIAELAIQDVAAFTQVGTGAVPRTVQSKLQEVASVKDFGATGNGITDDTVAIQAALNSGATSVFIPPGTFKFTTLTMPAVAGFEFFGVGVASALIQTGTGIKYPTIAANCFNAVSTIRDLYFDGTNGTGNTFDTTYAQTLDLLNLFFNNVPIGHTSLMLNGNPTSSTYAHDVRVKNIRIYSTTAGNAGITLGAFHSDSTIDGFQMNGGFEVAYCLLALNGALTTVVSNSHIYNATSNVVNLQGNNNDFGWIGCTFDNALGDIFNQVNSVRGRFTNCFIEAVNSGHHGIVFNNSYNNTLFNTSFSSLSGSSTACVQEVSGSSGTKVIGGCIDSTSNWTTLFNLNGVGSYAKGFEAYGSYDSIYSLVGTASTPQAQNTTINYGANTSVGLSNAAWSAPYAGNIMFANVFVDNTPAAGQTFLFNLQVAGVTIATGTISSGMYSTTITPSPAYSVGAGAEISIQSIFSTTSGSASPRYAITLNG